MLKPAFNSTPYRAACASQRGIVMLITLISLVIMLLASIALIRSTDANLLLSGHLSFKRDVVNQAERTMPVIKTLFATGGALVNASAKEADASANNYFATIQTSNIYGIPNQLMDTGSTVYTTNIIEDTSTGIKIRYMIDRMCLTAGAPSPASCSLSQTMTDGTGDGGFGSVKVSGIDTPIYRISIRATGPRNTEAYLQSTFTVQ